MLIVLRLELDFVVSFRLLLSVRLMRVSERLVMYATPQTPDESSLISSITVPVGRAARTGVTASR